MSLRRKSSVRDNDKNIEYGLQGYRLCRFCKTEVKPPRRTICSPECLHQWKIRSNVKYMRAFVYERDLGICAMCHTDTRYSKIAVENAWRDSRRAGIPPQESERLLDLTKSLNITIKESLKSLWHADHIVEVCNGGGESGLENIQTLCVKCHKEKSRLRRRNKPLS